VNVCPKKIVAVQSALTGSLALILLQSYLVIVILSVEPTESKERGIVMATMTEIALLQKELADAARADEAEFKKRILALSKTSAAELLSLRDHWSQEEKRNRKLDDRTQRKRHEAEIWLKAIDHVLSHPQALGPIVPVENENLGLAQAATYLNISTSTLYHWTSQNRIPHTTVGGKKLSFARTDLDVFLKGRRRQTNEDLERKAEVEVGKMRARRSKDVKR
jgi:excisionase family DNA binding protein